MNDTKTITKIVEIYDDETNEFVKTMNVDDFINGSHKELLGCHNVLRVEFFKITREHFQTAVVKK